MATASHWVLGQRIDSTTCNEVVSIVTDWAHERRSAYVCVSNVHMLMEGYDDPAFRTVVNESDLVVPDGRPLVWALWLNGVDDAAQVRGPSLMPLTMEAAEKQQIPVGFYGGSPETLALLKVRAAERFPKLQIAIAVSPPFRELTDDECSDDIEQLNASGARLLFVGLGCPKQERWMAERRGKVSAVMLGVGAAFDFFAGTKREAPELAQRLGLEWLFRLASEPGRLWRRYLRNNPRFAVLLVRDLLSRR